MSLSDQLDGPLRSGEPVEPPGDVERFRLVALGIAKPRILELYGVNAFPCVGDLLRFGPEDGNAARGCFDCCNDEVPNAVFIPEKPVNPAPGADVTPNIGFGLSPGWLGSAFPFLGSTGGGVDAKADVLLFLLASLLDAMAGLVVTLLLLVVVDHEEGPALAWPKGEMAEAKDKNPL